MSKLEHDLIYLNSNCMIYNYLASLNYLNYLELPDHPKLQVYLCQAVRSLLPEA